VLSLLVLLGTPSSLTAGSPSAALAEFTTPMTLAFAESQAARHSRVPTIRFRWVNDFAASPARYSLRPVELLAPLADLTGHSTQPTGTLTPERSTGRSPSPSSGFTTVATEQTVGRNMTAASDADQKSPISVQAVAPDRVIHQPGVRSSKRSAGSRWNGSQQGWAEHGRDLRNTC
jgi:hypothetical protein